MADRRGGLLGIALATALLAAACGAASSSAPLRPTEGLSPSPAAPPAPLPAPTPSCPDRVLAGMTEAQRVGQLLSLGLVADRLGDAELSAIQGEHVGSLWFAANSQAGVAGIRAVTDAVQAQATADATAGVRFLIAANQEGGQIQALKGPGFSTIPPATVQGATDPAILQGSAVSWGEQLVAAGVNMDFAPVLDVVPPGTDAQNQPIGVLQREYGHDPATAGGHGAAFVRGMRQAGVATTVKHFPGLGRVQGNTDFTANVVDATTTANDPYLQSFAQGVAAGAPFVMVALATYTRIDPGHMAVFSPVVMGQVLRRQLGFQGVVVSDDLGSATAVGGIPAGQRAVDFIAAGGDLVVAKTVGAVQAMAIALLVRARSDAGFAALVDASALRVLRTKQAYGLLPC
jgi:beta-N-acetylhexosaminidase